MLEKLNKEQPPRRLPAKSLCCWNATHAITDPKAPIPGMIAVVTALTVSGAAFPVPHASTIGPALLPPVIDRKHAAYLERIGEVRHSVRFDSWKGHLA